MRKIHAFIGLLVLTFCGMSCKENYIETNLGDQPLSLTASAGEVMLDITADQSNAVTFTWTPGSNHNTNSAITYTFELGVEGTGFAGAVKTTLTQGRNSMSYKTGDLNSLLLEKFEISPNTAVNLEARVLADVHHDQVPQQVSETVKLKVTTYKPVSSTLFLIGSAAPNGWSADNATLMNVVAGAAGSFTWQGKLSPGELKFITTKGAFLPSYNKGADNTRLLFRESDSQPDEKFIIPTAGIYKIVANIINLSVIIEAMDAPEYGNLWFVGHSTGWSFKPMTLNAADPFVFHYNAEITEGGEFKVATSPSFDSNVVFLRPETHNQGPGTGLKVVKWSESEKPGGTNDYKWNIPGGVYKIKLDTRDMRIDIVKFTPFTMIYLVGDASAKGWDVGNATPMNATASPYKFTWTGTLKPGELKFTCDKQTDWNGSWFLAGMNGAAPTGEVEQMIFSAKGSVPDNKWKIPEEGKYLVELDQLNETVKIVKQ